MGPLAALLPRRSRRGNHPAGISAHHRGSGRLRHRHSAEQKWAATHSSDSSRPKKNRVSLDLWPSARTNPCSSARTSFAVQSFPSTRRGRKGWVNGPGALRRSPRTRSPRTMAGDTVSRLNAAALTWIARSGSTCKGTLSKSTARSTATFRWTSRRPGWSYFRRTMSAGNPLRSIASRETTSSDRLSHSCICREAGPCLKPPSRPVRRKCRAYDQHRTVGSLPLRDGRTAWNAIRAGVLSTLRVIDKISLDLRVGANDHYVRRCGRNGNRHKRPGGVVANRGGDRRRGRVRADMSCEKGVSVRRSAGHRRHSNHATPASAVFHHHRLTELVAQSLRQNARQGVRTAAGNKRDNDLDAAVRPGRRRG